MLRAQEKTLIQLTRRFEWKYPILQCNLFLTEKDFYFCFENSSSRSRSVWCRPVCSQHSHLTTRNRTRLTRPSPRNLWTSRKYRSGCSKDRIRKRTKCPDPDPVPDPHTGTGQCSCSVLLWPTRPPTACAWERTALSSSSTRPPAFSRPLSSRDTSSSAAGAAHCTHFKLLAYEFNLLLVFRM